MALAEILAAKRAAVAERERALPLARFVGDLRPSDRSLLAALGGPGGGRVGAAGGGGGRVGAAGGGGGRVGAAGGGGGRVGAARAGRVRFVMECKKASPSRGLLRADFDPAAIAAAYVAAGADAISVLTDEPYFQGSFADLEAVRAAVPVPVLCKDFVLGPYQLYEARRHGADAVLLMLSVLDDATCARCLAVARELSLDALVEVHDAAELDRARALGARLVGINNRDLRTLRTDLAVTERLAPHAGADVTLVSESGVGSHRDVLRLRPLVDAFLVGTSLVRAPDVGAAARALVHGRVKVCGLTTPDGARAARDAGASFGGLIFAPGSPRRVTLDAAADLAAAAPLAWVGVFVDAPPEEVAAAAHRLGLAAVQLHGAEDRAYVAALRPRLPAGCAVWKAARVRDRVPRRAETGADRLLLDTWQPDREGGTGARFDWALLRDHPERAELILAGGLAPDNAAAADRLGAWALDVNSGVEDAPGVKSPSLLRAFFAALRGYGRDSGADAA
jgi:indole-3-glycerol phosphate synthase/phosphoribosylanthranilate isomerase